VKREQVDLLIPVEGKDAEGKAREPYKHSYQKDVAENNVDIRAIAAARAKGDTDEEKQNDAAAYIVRAFNYGHDLIVRQAERQKASRASQGPEKQINKGVEFLVTQGFTAEAARELIIAQRTAAGLPV
jgi:hypothetical protein